MIRATVVWLGLFVIAFANGALREVGIKKFIPEPWAHHFSAVTAVSLFSIYVFVVWNHLLISSFREATFVGIYWLILTFLTETFVLGRLMSKQSWEKIFESYDLMAGNMWPLVLVWVGLLPVVVFMWKRS